MHARNAMSSTFLSCNPDRKGEGVRWGMKTRAKKAAAELKAIYKRHGLDRLSLVALAKTKGINLEPTTVWRLQQGNAKTEPRTDTMRKIAEAVGEPRSVAFPSSLDDAAGDPEIDELIALVKRLSASGRVRLLERAHALLEDEGPPRTQADGRAQLDASTEPRSEDEESERSYPATILPLTGTRPRSPKKPR